MKTWKVHIAWSYPLELLGNEIIDMLRVQLWMHSPDFAYLVGADEDMLALLYVPASTEAAAMEIGLKALDEALTVLDLPGVTSYDMHAMPDSPEDHPIAHGIEGLIVYFC